MKRVNRKVEITEEQKKISDFKGRKIEIIYSE